MGLKKNCFFHINRSGLNRVCVVCVFFPFILDIKFIGRTSRRGHTGGRSHRISHPPSFCGACLKFSREKDSAIPILREFRNVVGKTRFHAKIFSLRDRTHVPTCQRVTRYL